MRLSLIGLLLTALVLAGCAGEEPKSTFKHVGSKTGVARAPDMKGMQDKAVKPADGQPAAPGAPGAVKKVDPRKIIYTSRVELIVDDFDKAQEGMLKLLKELDGYISGAEITGEPGEPRRGTWTLRVPAGSFEDFLTGVKTLGELRKQTRDTEDVSDRYYDTKAAVTNLEGARRRCASSTRKRSPARNSANCSRLIAN